MFLLPTLLDLVYPRSCVACGNPVLRGQGYVCWDCASSFSVICEPYCSICGDPVDGMVEHEYICAFCQRHKPHFEMARSAVKFRGAVQPILHSLKYGKVACVSRDLVPFLVACVRTQFPRVHFDAVTSVPLYPRKERERTFNQSSLLAKGLAAEIGLPYMARCLRRTRDTATQTGLDASGRRGNVRGAFAALNEKWLDGRNFLLVDDVMTTGATVDEASRVLKEGGAAGVFVVTVARG